MSTVTHYSFKKAFVQANKIWADLILLITFIPLIKPILI